MAFDSSSKISGSMSTTPEISWSFLNSYLFPLASIIIVPSGMVRSISSWFIFRNLQGFMLLDGKLFC